MYIGLDLAENALVDCASLTRQGKLGCVAGDALQIPLKKHSAEILLNVESSQCYSSLETFVSKVSGVLKPGVYNLFESGKFVYYFFWGDSMTKMTCMIEPDKALKGRERLMPLTNVHAVFNTPIREDFDKKYSRMVVGMGCFWGAERLFWQLNGVHTTAAGYAGGFTPNPEYEEVCSGMTGHTEVVLIIYDPLCIDLQDLLAVFWQKHDPTQGMRQGNDIGTQYRSAIYLDNPNDYQLALSSRDGYASALMKSGFPAITTEIRIDNTFYYAEEYHQQYLAKNPSGYCGLRGTGVEY